MHAYYSKSLSLIEDALHYAFRQQGLLLEALTHSSYANEHPEEEVGYNERLEFLGDSVLGLVVVEELFRNCPGHSESQMAKMKSYLVSRAVLSEIAREIGVGDVIRLGKGEEASGGRGKDNILADALEAIFGAVFLDGGYVAARDVINSLFGGYIEYTIKTGKYHDYKTDLQEKTQALYGTLPEYRLVLEEGEEHNKKFTVEVYVEGQMMGRGSGRSKKEAQMNAAACAIKKFSEL